MLKQIIETINTKNSWGKNQLINEIKPLIDKELYTFRSDMNTIKTIIIQNYLIEFENYIESKACHGKIELQLALLNMIAKEYEMNN